MALSAGPLSSLKKKNENFQYNLYQCSYAMRVNPFQRKNETVKNKNEVKIVGSAFQEHHGAYLLALVCDNDSLLLRYKAMDGELITKQVNWFENPSKQIAALCIDPLRSAWILCACVDSKLYLVPAMALLRETGVDGASSWSRNDLSQINFAKPLKGIPSCVVWWHTLDDTNIGIIGTDVGEIIFVNLSQHQEVGRSCVKEKIEDMKLTQNFDERLTHLYIYTPKKLTLQLLLEQPTPNTDVESPSSLTQAFDLGYDMVTEYNVESILNSSRHENRDDINFQNRIQELPNEFIYETHEINYQHWVTKYDAKYSALEVYSDINKRTADYVYFISAQADYILLSENLLLIVGEKEGSISLLSRYFSVTTFGRQGLKKLDPSKNPDIQSFQLAEHERVLDCYKYTAKRPSDWNNLFPHSKGHKECAALASFIIVTENGILECKPRTSPEHYFCELAMTLGIDVAGKLGCTLDLNIPLLHEYVADQMLSEKDIQEALKFYNLSKCDPIKRATQLVEHASVTDGLIFMKQVLKKQPNNLGGKDRKKLSNMAILCYVEQSLECQRLGTFSKNLADSFRSFICDNFDYDEESGMELLISCMIESLMEMAKARGKIQNAFKMLGEHGIFSIPSLVQAMLIDSGYADVICRSANVLFIKHMEPSQALRFLLTQPNINKELVSTLSFFLPKLEETVLLQMARVFDPSRQYIKPLLEKCSANIRKRTGSSVSLTSSVSTASSDDPTLPSIHEIILLFIKTIIRLNGKRKICSLPNIKSISRHLSGQLSWNTQKRSESLESNEMLISEVAQLKVACGKQHIAFVTSEKELYTWGQTSYGRLGHGDLIEDRGAHQPLRVESLHMHGIQVIAVACGTFHTIALCEEGVFAWGSNKYGQLGIGDKRNRSRPILLTEFSTKHVSSVTCGAYHTLAITSDYKVYAWGWGIHGQLGLNSAENQVYPQHVKLLDEHRIVQAAAGHAHSAVLTSRGLVYTFGGGLYGQLGIGINVKRSIPQLVEMLITDHIYLIACGCFETVAISEENIIYCWGRNYHQFHICGKAESASYGRQMASSQTDISHRYLPEDLPFKLQDHIIQLVCGNWHYMALTSNNGLYTWGYNDCGQLGHYNKMEQLAPRPVKALARRTICGIGTGGEFSVAVDADDQVLVWGRADGGLLGIEKENNSTSPVARRSLYCILAPTPVPGLPIHFDQVSIDPDQNDGGKREYLFDQTYDLPDLSTVGESEAPYSTEAVLVTLYKLQGLYTPLALIQFASVNKQWFVLSYCYEILQEWDQVFIYRSMAVQEYYQNKSTVQGFMNKMNLVVMDLLNKFEDFLPDDSDEDANILEMVVCLMKIFDFWIEKKLDMNGLEDSLRKHMEVLCPLYTIVLFGFLSSQYSTSSMLQNVLRHCQTQHCISKQFSTNFYNELLKRFSDQLCFGVKWYDFLAPAKPNETQKSVDAPSMELNLGVDQMIADVLNHKQKVLSIKSYINLSNAVVTTLSAATIAQKVESTMLGGPLNSKVVREIKVADEKLFFGPDSAVFTCSHNLPRYYMLETVIPEFKSRMSELPEPLCNTASMMGKFYEQAYAKIPMACPYCVYNNLRNSQLQVMRETGVGMINMKSSVWEI